MGIYAGVNSKRISNSTCIFGSMSGLPPRVGVPVRILDQPNYGLHCRSTSTNPRCCCLPISHTWYLKCDAAKAYLDKNGLNPKTNQVFSGGVGNPIKSLLMGGAF